MSINIKKKALNVKNGDTYDNFDMFFLGDVGEAVDDWFEEHPEAVTNVADNSITAAKLAPSVRESVEEVTDLKSALQDFEKTTSYVTSGVKNNNDVIFTSDSVSAGDVLYYSVTASSAGGVAYIGFYDSSDTRLAYYGKGSGSSTVLDYDGTAEIPSGFSYAKVYTSNGLTLTINYIYNGKPTDVKFTEVNSAITTLDGRIDSLSAEVGGFVYSVTNYSDWHQINLTGYSAGDKFLVKTITTENVSFLNIGFLKPDNTETTVYSNQQPGQQYYLTIPENHSGIRIAYKSATVLTATYQIIAIKLESDSVAGYVGDLRKEYEENKNIVMPALGTIDSPFSMAVDSKLNGVVAFEFLGNVNVGDTAYDVNDYEEFRVTNFYYKSSFYMYMPVQGYKNGSWTPYDAIEIALANAPNEDAVTILSSKYGRFRIAIVPNLMGTGSVTGVDYRIKHQAVNPFFVALRQKADKTILDLGIGDFEFQDHISHIVTVDTNGNGDYTTIKDAYDSITDSSFLNQYEIVVYPGIYEEVNLMPPNFTHTHGLKPNSVTVTSVGKTGTQPVFEQRNGNSKLSNMKIISGTGYCVHQDSSLNGFVLVNENLHCVKDYGTDVSDYGWENKTNPSVVGDGAQYYGAKFIWRNCTFENGEVACHTNSSSDDHANQHFILDNCRLVNARIWLGMAGSDGASPNSHCVAEIKGLYTPPGCQSLKYKLGARIDENNPNFIWQIIGGENENFAVVCDNSLDVETSDMWTNINTNEKTLVQIGGSVTKGQWLKYDLSVCGVNEPPQNVFGVALENGSSGDTISVWIGNAFAHTATSGEYGIDVNGTLSASAATKIGRVYNHIFYRY